jgi:hypothetical protein
MVLKHPIELPIFFENDATRKLDSEEFAFNFCKVCTIRDMVFFDICAISPEESMDGENVYSGIHTPSDIYFSPLTKDQILEKINFAMENLF